MQRFITYVLKEARIIRRASLIFATAILVIAGVLFYGIWQAMDWRYSGIIANMNAELSSAKAVRDEYSLGQTKSSTIKIVRRRRSKEKSLSQNGSGQG
jgi:hypothetical protein